MKTTVIIEKNGSMYLTVAYKPGEVTSRNVRPLSTLCIADVSEIPGTGFSVRFRKPYFKRFDKEGFLSLKSAVDYEQDILDSNLDDYISTEPEELMEPAV